MLYWCELTLAKGGKGLSLNFNYCVFFVHIQYIKRFIVFAILVCVCGCHSCDKLNDNHNKMNHFDSVYLSTYSEQIFLRKMVLTYIDSVRNDVTVQLRLRSNSHWEKRQLTSFITQRYCSDKALRRQMVAGANFMNVITNEKKQATLNVKVDVFRCYSFFNFKTLKDKLYLKAKNSHLIHVNPILAF